MTALGSISGGFADTANQEANELRRRLRAWMDDPSNRSGSPLGRCLFVSCRDALDSAIESLGELRQAAVAIDEYEWLRTRA
jgi:hypothetical protein